MTERIKIREELICHITQAVRAVKTAGPDIELLADETAWFYSDAGRGERFGITYRLDDDTPYYEVSI